MTKSTEKAGSAMDCGFAFAPAVGVVSPGGTRSRSGRPRPYRQADPAESL
jgi:hypothetical protein